MGDTGVMQRRPAHAARRRVAAHACPVCRRPWALRGIRTETGAWLIRCSSCGWQDERRAQLPGPPTPRASPSARRAVLADDMQRTPGALLYDDDDHLLDSVEDYLVAGWAAGGAGLVIATPEHRAALRRRLTVRGLTASLGEGRLVELDAAATLEQFVRGGLPDADLFDRTVGSLVRDHAAAAPLRIFGEMVDVLWAGGDSVGALQLARLWTDLQERVRFRLLCAYATDHVDPADRDLVTRAHERDADRR